MNFQLSAALRLLIPVFLLVTGFLLRPYIAQLGSDPQTLISYLPYGLSLVCLLLAIQFNRARFLLLAIVTAGSYWVVQTQLQVSLTDPAAARAYNTLGFGLPAVALALLVVDERGLLNLFGAGYLVGVAIICGMAWVYAGWVVQYTVSSPWWFELWSGENYVLSRAASYFTALVVAAGVGLAMWRADYVEVAMAGSLAGFWLLLSRLHLTDISVAMFTSVGLLQVICLLRSSHAMAYRDELTGLLGRRRT